MVVKPKKAKQKQAVTKAEVTRLGKLLRGLGGLAGGTIGGMVGQAGVGSHLGTGLGASLSRWLGSGSYAVQSNSLLAAASRKTSADIPAMHRTATSIIVSHKEYLGEILGSTTFSVLQTFPLNPGMSLTFPWLSGLATQFQEYRFRGLVFHYVPTSGSAISSTNAALGTVMLQTSYRASDSAPVSKVEMVNEYWACEGSPAEAFVHPIECKSRENVLSAQYVRSGDVPIGATKELYDLGETYIAVSGQQASGNVLGDLWVTYEVELLKPIVSSNVTARVKSGTGAFTSPVIANLFSNGTQTIKGGLFTAATNTISILPGNVGVFSILKQVVPDGSGFTSTSTHNNPTLVNCSGYTDGPTGTAFMDMGDNTGTLYYGLYHLAFVRIVDPLKTATITYPTQQWTGTATAVNIVVSQIA